MIKTETENKDQLIERLRDRKINSVEREDIVYELWNSGNYETKVELADELEYTSIRNIDALLKASEIRKKLNLNDSISTRDITDTSGLPLEKREEILLLVQDRLISKREIRKFVKKKKIEQEHLINKKKRLPIKKKREIKPKNIEKMNERITIFQNIAFRVINRIKSESIKDYPSIYKDKCISLMQIMVDHLNIELEKLNKIIDENNGRIVYEIN